MKFCQEVKVYPHELNESEYKIFESLAMANYAFFNWLDQFMALNQIICPFISKLFCKTIHVLFTDMSYILHVKPARNLHQDMIQLSFLIKKIMNTKCEELADKERIKAEMWERGFICERIDSIACINSSQPAEYIPNTPLLKPGHSVILKCYQGDTVYTYIHIYIYIYIGYADEYNEHNM